MKELRFRFRCSDESGQWEAYATGKNVREAAGKLRRHYKRLFDRKVSVKVISNFHRGT